MPHNCFVPDILASPLHALLKSFSTSQDATTIIDFSIILQLSKWQITSITEWHSGCYGQCDCSATNLCGPYLVLDLNRRSCGCIHSIQIRVNAYTERFVFLDDLAQSFNTGRDSDDSPPTSSSSSPSPSHPLKHSTLQSQTPKHFSLLDLSLLLSAIHQSHSTHRWTDSYADRSLSEFTSFEVFAFLDYFLEREWRCYVWEYRRDIAKRFFDGRVGVWNRCGAETADDDDDDDDGFPTVDSNEPELDHERRLLSCMKDRVSFVNDELRLLWMSLAARKCALEASKLSLDLEDD